MSTAPLLDTLASYVSPLVLRRFALDPSPPTSPTSERISTAVLFADIAGFTALTERLAQRGPAGAEELTTLLNHYFGQLIDVVSAHGGEVVKFAGDALLACWPVVPHEDDLLMATCRAAACGLRIQTLLHHYEITPGVHLALHLSIGAGALAVVHVGGVFDRWEFVVVGEPLEQVRQAEPYAAPGQVILSPAAWTLLQNRCLGQSLPGGYVRLTSMSVSPPVARSPLPTLTPEMEQGLQNYIPAAIAPRLRAGHSEWLGELRRVTVLFVNLPDLHDTTPLELAQAGMCAFQTALYRYEGSVNKLSVDDKGVTAVAVLGLPPLAHEDDAVRGVQAALAIQASLRELGMRSAIGITSGRVFCGVIGNDMRREYTIMGDAVNLSARLMQGAPGQILCDQATYQAAQNQCVFDPLPPIQVKGKTEPVSIYLPRGTTSRPQSPSRSLIGRTAERDCLMTRLEALLHHGVGGVVIIEGEAGLGKSHLANDLLLAAAAQGVRIRRGDGDAIERTTPYYPWRAVFQHLFEAETALDTPEALWSLIRALLSEDPEAERLLPLLSAVLPLRIPDTDFTAQMTAPVRAERTHAFLARVLHAATAQTPTLLLLEDAHWFDSISWALLEMVSREVTSALIVITTRPLVEPVPEEYPRVCGRPATQQLHLSPLAPDDTVALVCQCLGVIDLPTPVMDFIQAKTAGHPFFSEELAYALRDANVLDVKDGRGQLVLDAQALGTVPFPETLDGVITSRFDRLPLSQQLLLKAASVIGSVVPVRLLQAINLQPMASSQLANMLAALHQSDFLLPEPAAPEETYHFKHALMREAVYNLLLLAQRHPLHRAAAAWYEQAYADDLATVYPQLAHHYTEAELNGQAITYWHKTAQWAIRHAAFAEAIAHLTKGLELLQTLPESAKRDQQELNLQTDLGIALQTIRGYAAPEVDHAYTRARQLCHRVGDTVQLMSVLRGQQLFYMVRADYRIAFEIGHQMLALAEGDQNPEYLLEAHAALGTAAIFLGDFTLSRFHLEQGLAIDHAHDQPLQTFQYSEHSRPACLSHLARTLWLLGYADQALQRSQEGLAQAQTLSIPMSLARVQVMHAILYQVRRDIGQAHEWLEKTSAYATEHGILHWLTLGSIIKGWVLAQQGRLNEGAALLHQSLKSYRVTGAKLGLASFLAMQAELYGQSGEIEAGLQVIAEAQSHIDATSEAYYAAELHRLKGELLLKQPRPDATTGAETCFQQALQVARDQSAKAWELRAATSLARLWHGQGQVEEARVLLTPVYSWFTEGFDTPDLQDAGRLLEDLTAAS